MKNIFLILSSSFYFSAIAQGPALQWAKSFGGANGEQGQSIAIDALGNAYVTGSFAGVIDFDPGPAIFNLTANGNVDIFVSKLDAQGNFIWAKNFGGSGAHGDGYSVVTDASANIYITGYFNGTMDFDPGAGTYTMSTPGTNGVYISKLDPSGNFVWAKSITGSPGELGNSLTVDLNGNVYTCGIFNGVTDFDPNAGTYTLNSVGSFDIYIQKLDASGNFVWVKSMGGPNSESAAAIKTDALGNIYTTGYFQTTVDFDPNAGTYTLMSAGLNDIFISKLDPSGNFIWAKGIGGINNDLGSCITVDAMNNVYFSGDFSETVDFDADAGTYTITSFGSNDIFISKLNSNGTFAWAKKMGGTLTDAGHSIKLDNSGNIYTTGHYSGTADLDPGAGTFTITSNGNNDVFFSKLDANGDFIWGGGMGGFSNDGGSALVLDGMGNIYSCGGFQETVDFELETGQYNLTSAGNLDVYIHKMSACCAGIEEIKNSHNELKIYPNPNNGKFSFITDSDISKIEIINMAGQKIYLNNIPNHGNDPYAEINLSDQPKGLYFYNIITKNNVILTGKISVH